MRNLKEKQGFIISRMDELIDSGAGKHEAAKLLLEEMGESGKWNRIPKNFHCLYSMYYNLKIKQKAGLL